MRKICLKKANSGSAPAPTFLKVAPAPVVDHLWSVVSFLRLRLQSCSKITESYSNPASVYVKNQNSKVCFHSSVTREYFTNFNHNIIQTLGLC